MRYIKNIISDIRNYINFIGVIKKEKNNPKSIYNIYNFRHNIPYTKIGFILTLPEECSQIDEESRTMYIYEKLAPVIEYLDLDLKFSECLFLSEPDNWVEVDDKGKLKHSLSYTIEFAFKPIVMNKKMPLKIITFIFLLYYAWKLYF